MKFFVVLFFLLVGFLGFMAWMRWREKKYLKKPTREAIKPMLREAFEAEKKDALRRKESFEKALKRHGS